MAYTVIYLRPRSLRSAANFLFTHGFLTGAALGAIDGLTEGPYWAATALELYKLQYNYCDHCDGNNNHYYNHYYDHYYDYCHHYYNCYYYDC